ncbi:MAG: proline racemase family protein [Candidatus Hodarchaeales archaeon]|jgi:trans-L-3-hydroxyproline dehydratase
MTDTSTYLKKSAQKWNPPDNWEKITTIDAHTEGEPLRVIISGYPELQGKTILEKRRFAKNNLDSFRTALMWEPRGHADMYGCIITPAITPNADFGVIFLHNEGYSTMCGHGIIGVTKIVLEIGLIPMSSPITTVKIDSPAGLITAYAKVENNQVKSVYFHNVPSFVLTLDEVVDVPGLGEIKYDIAFGGAFYAYVQAKDAELKLIPNEYSQLIEKGMAIKRAVMENRAIEHPFEEDLNFLYGTIFIGSPLTKGVDSRNVCIFAEGEVDRCPTGTGVGGRMAIHYTRGEIEINQPMIIESILGSQFSGKVVETTKFGPYEAVIPEVEGRAFITGKNEFLLDPNDPLKKGFIFR